MPTDEAVEAQVEILFSSPEAREYVTSMHQLLHDGARLRALGLSLIIQRKFPLTTDQTRYLEDLRTIHPAPKATPEKITRRLTN